MKVLMMLIGLLFEKELKVCDPKSNMTSYIFKHYKIFKHMIYYDGIEILDTAKTEYRLKI